MFKWDEFVSRAVYRGTRKRDMTLKTIDDMRESVQKVKQKSQQIPNRLFGAMIVRDEAV